jgi:anti-sigma B factor antagonist
MSKFFELEVSDDITVINLNFGEIRLSEQNDFKTELSDLAGAEPGKFVMDFRNVSFVSSLLMAITIYFLKIVKGGGGGLKISGLSEESATVFKISKIDQLFDIYPDVQSALDGFSTAV